MTVMPIAAAMIAPRLCVRRSPGDEDEETRPQAVQRPEADEQQNRIRDQLADRVLLKVEGVERPCNGECRRRQDVCLEQGQMPVGKRSERADDERSQEQLVALPGLDDVARPRDGAERAAP